MLSSDDLIRPEALTTYRAFYDALGPDMEQDVFTSTWDVIDPEDRVTGHTGPEPNLSTQGDCRSWMRSRADRSTAWTPTSCPSVAAC